MKQEMGDIFNNEPFVALCQLNDRIQQLLKGVLRVSSPFLP